MRVDENGDGKIDKISEFYEDGYGKVIKAFYDDNADGKNDSVSLFDYDENGKLSRRYDDKDADEHFDEYVDIWFDEEGNPIDSEPKELGWRQMGIDILSKVIDQQHLPPLIQQIEENIQDINKKD